MATLEEARYVLVYKLPFLARAVYALSPRLTTEVPTASVDEHWRLYWNPEWLERLSPKEAATVLYHEVLHLLRDHTGRFRDLGLGPENLRAWNVAADAELNDDIRREGWPFPSVVVVGGQEVPASFIFPERLGQPEGLLAEEYYRSLPEVTLDLTELLRQAGIGPDGEGSGVTGTPASWEDREGRGISEAQAEVLREAVAQAVLQQASRNPGSVPGHLVRWAQERKQPKVDWRRALQSLVRQHLASAQGRTDYRYDRPSRRQAVSPFVLPRLRAPQPKVAVVIDTSGSVQDEELAQALAEIEAVVRTTGVPVDVCSGDTKLQTFQRGLFRASQVTLQGGGGTDLGQVLAELAARRVPYDLVVVITDGYSPWPEEDPGPWPVLVVCTTDQPAPAWAKLVKVQVS